MKTLNILIINSVPANGGDEALLRATLYILEKTYNNPVITISCNDVINTRKLIPGLTIIGDLDHVFSNPFTRWSLGHLKIAARSLIYDRYDLSKIFEIPKILLTREEKITTEIIKKVDLVISSSGGYLHDFYNNEQRLKVINLLKKLKKKVILFGQSIGPFWKSKNTLLYLDTLNSVDLILLREQISLQHLKKIGLNLDNTFVTTDTAFVLHKKYAHLFRYRKETKNRIVFAFRNWQKESDYIIKLAKTIAIFLIDFFDIEITFLSTCQGLNSYKDDSHFAEKIIATIPSSFQQYCKIDKHKYSIPDLIKKYSLYDGYIGMRLHGAILAMLGGTPAFNIGYEDKTKGIYDFLGLPEQHAFYKEDMVVLEKKISFFMKNLSKINNNFLKSKIEFAADTVEKNIYYLKSSYVQS